MRFLVLGGTTTLTINTTSGIPRGFLAVTSSAVSNSFGASFTSSDILAALLCFAVHSRCRFGGLRECETNPRGSQPRSPIASVVGQNSCRGHMVEWEHHSFYVCSRVLFFSFSRDEW